MYSSCLYCRASLGKNDVVRGLPIGQRIAYDRQSGRLWIVCPKCDRWNLVPIEERWEPLESCEAQLPEAVRSVTHEGIALVQLRDGTSLVRISGAKPREVARYRHGNRLSTRRSAHLITGGGALVGLLALQSLMLRSEWLTAGRLILGMLSATATAILAGVWLGRRRKRKVALALPSAGGRVVVRRGHLRTARIGWSEADKSLTLSMNSDAGELALTRSLALRCAGIALANLNREGASDEDIARAIDSIERRGTAANYIAWIVRRRPIGTRAVDDTTSDSPTPENTLVPLSELGGTDSLALELAVHEELDKLETRAELSGMLVDWREADEIAAIADDLLLPDSVATALKDKKQSP